MQNRHRNTALHDITFRPYLQFSSIMRVIYDEVPEAEIGSIINIQNKQKETILHQLLGKLRFLDLADDNRDTRNACIIYRNHIIKLLTQRGVDVGLKNNNNYVSQTARDINPAEFDRCAMAANKIITKNNAARRLAIDNALIEIMPRDVAMLTAQYDDQPLVPVGRPVAEVSRFGIGGHWDSSEGDEPSAGPAAPAAPIADDGE